MGGRVYTEQELRELTHIPSDSVQMVWRYMDLAKLLDLITTGQVYFTRADLLNDKLEVIPPNANFLSTKSELNDFPEAIVEMHIKELRKEYLKHQKETFVNCWHINDGESFSMWKAYASINGVAIQSTTNRLWNQFRSTRPGIFIHKVVYIDHDLDEIPRLFRDFNALQKRKAFENENELRLLIYDDAEWRDPIYGYSWMGEGVKVPVNVGDLVEAIYVSPETGAWVRDSIEKVVKQFGLSIPVVQSSI